MRSIALIACASLISGEALAQSYYCSRPSEPNIPSPFSADYDRMKRAQREVSDYMDEMRNYVECVQRELNDAIAEAEDVNDEWDSAVRRFNNSQ